MYFSCNLLVYYGFTRWSYGVVYAHAGSLRSYLIPGQKKT